MVGLTAGSCESKMAQGEYSSFPRVPSALQQHTACFLRLLQSSSCPTQVDSISTLMQLRKGSAGVCLD